MSGTPLNLLRQTTCPHCWATFAPEEILWISAHTDLLGDPRLGADHQQRFLPTRFNLEGKALDARGFVCQAHACPKCHLSLPRAMLETEPTFVSILGTPACGKSCFLTALVWELRRLLPLHFALSFVDADTISNRSLNEYEESLFLNPHADDLVPLANLIRKTEIGGNDLYDTVTYGNQQVSYPRPFLFTLQPQEHHPNYAAAPSVASVLCLYDNAGEHFRAGEDSTSTPVTRHLTQARLLLFLFDPTQDFRFRQLCRKPDGLSPGRNGSRSSRQEAVLVEATDRVRRALGLPQNVKHKRPLIVIVTKYDAWDHLLENRIRQEPWVETGRLAGVDTDLVERRSSELRALLLRVCPEIVRRAEDFSQQVVYVPVSALGQSPVPDPRSRALVIRPRDIQPVWATVPLLYGMCRWMPGLIPSLARPPAPVQASKSTSTPSGKTLTNWFAT